MENVREKESREKVERLERHAVREYSRFDRLDKQITEMELVLHTRHAREAQAAIAKGKEDPLQSEDWKPTREGETRHKSRVDGDTLPQRIMQRREVRGLLPASLHMAPTYRQEAQLRMPNESDLNDDSALLLTKAKVAEVVNDHVERSIMKQHVDRQVGEWAALAQTRGGQSQTDAEHRLAEIEVEAPMESTVDAVLLGSSELKDRLVRCTDVGEDLSDALHRYLHQSNALHGVKKNTGTTTTHIFITGATKPETMLLIPPECVVLPSACFADSLRAMSKTEKIFGLNNSRQMEQDKIHTNSMENRLQTKEKLLLKSMREKEQVMRMFRTKMSGMRARITLRENQLVTSRDCNEALITGDGFTQMWKAKEESEGLDRFATGTGVSDMMAGLRAEMQESQSRDRKKIDSLQAEIQRIIELHNNDAEDSEMHIRKLMNQIDDLTRQIQLLQHDLLIKEDVIFEKNQLIRSIQGERAMAQNGLARNTREMDETRDYVATLRAAVETEKRKMAGMLTLQEHAQKMEDAGKAAKEALIAKDLENGRMRKEIAKFHQLRDEYQAAAASAAEMERSSRDDLKGARADVEAEKANAMVKLTGLASRVAGAMGSVRAVLEKRIEVAPLRLAVWGETRSIYFDFYKTLSFEGVGNDVLEMLKKGADAAFHAPEEIVTERVIEVESKRRHSVVEEERISAAGRRKSISGYADRTGGDILRAMMQSLSSQLAPLLLCASFADVAEITFQPEVPGFESTESEAETWAAVMDVWHGVRERVKTLFAAHENANQFDMSLGTSMELQARLQSTHVCLAEIVHAYSELMMFARQTIAAYLPSDSSQSEFEDRKSLREVVRWHLSNAKVRFWSTQQCTRVTLAFHSHRKHHQTDREVARATQDWAELGLLDTAYEARKNRILHRLQQHEIGLVVEESERVLCFVELQKKRLRDMVGLAGVARAAQERAAEANMDTLREYYEGQLEELRGEMADMVKRAPTATAGTQTPRPPATLHQSTLTDPPEDPKKKAIKGTRDGYDEQTREVQTDHVEMTYVAAGDTFGDDTPLEMPLPADPVASMDRDAQLVLLAKKLREALADLKELRERAGNANDTATEASEGIRTILRNMDRAALTMTLAIVRRKDLEAYDKMTMERLVHTMRLKLEDILRASSLKYAQLEDEIESLSKQRQAMAYEKKSLMDAHREFESHEGKAESKHNDLRRQLAAALQELDVVRNKRPHDHLADVETLDPDLERPFARRMPGKGALRPAGSQTDSTLLMDFLLEIVKNALTQNVKGGRAIPAGPEESVNLAAPRAKLHSAVESYMDHVRQSMNVRDGSLVYLVAPRPTTAMAYVYRAQSEVTPTPVPVVSYPAVVSGGKGTTDVEVVIYSPRRHPTDVCETSQRLTTVLEKHRGMPRPHTAVPQERSTIPPPGGAVPRPVMCQTRQRPRLQGLRPPTAAAPPTDPLPNVTRSVVGKPMPLEVKKK